MHSQGASQVALVVKNLPANARDIRVVGSTPGSRRSPGGGHGNPLQYSCLENPMDRGAWRATVHRLTKSWTRLKRLNTHTCMVKARGEKMAPDSLVKIHLKVRTTPEVAESKFQR